MITVDENTIHQAMRVLDKATHPEARLVSLRLRRAMYAAVERDARFNNETPALCRPQI